MTKTALTASSRSPFAFINRILRMLDRVPEMLLALPLRAAVIFWNGHGEARQLGYDHRAFHRRLQGAASAAELAANMALTIELATPVLVVLGLLTRFAALVLLGMTTVSKCSSVRRPGRRVQLQLRSWVPNGRERIRLPVTLKIACARAGASCGHASSPTPEIHLLLVLRNRMLICGG
jgi:hypothetical protein